MVFDDTSDRNPGSGAQPRSFSPQDASTPVYAAPAAPSAPARQTESVYNAASNPAPATPAGPTPAPARQTESASAGPASSGPRTTAQQTVPTAPAKPPKKPVSNRKLLGILIAVIAVFLASVAAFLLFAYPGFLVVHSDSTSTETALTPVTPIENTDLANAIPKTDGAFAMISQTIASSWSAQDPIHQYQMVYQDNNSADSIQFLVNVAQFVDVNAATKAYKNLQTNPEAVIETGGVLVNEIQQGEYVYYADTTDEAQGIVLWHNGTVVIEVKGPKNLVMEFYFGYAL
jgi:hypothetical protein